VPEALAAVVRRGIERDPAARYGSAGELARAARSALSDSRGGVAATSRAADPTTDLVVDHQQPFAPEPLSTGLSRQVLSLCEEALKAAHEPGILPPLEAVRSRLLAPLRVGVIGGTGELRAQMLSALLGRGVRAGELAQTVSFRYGAPDPSTERTMISLVSGASTPSELAGTELAALADAYLVVVPYAGGRPSDGAQTRVLADLAGLHTTAVNSVAVLTSDDMSTSADDAAEIKRALRAQVARVVPCCLRLAVLANTGMISDELIQQLGDVLVGAEVPAEFPQEVVDVLTREGIRIAEDLYDEGHELTAVGLTRRLRELSGIEEVMGEIDGLQQRADALKAARALADLEQLSYRGAELAFLRDRVESMRFEPRMHVLGLVGALERCVTNDVDLPDQLLAELEQLVTARSPGGRLGIAENARGAELAQAALSEFQSWKVFENSGRASPPARRIAHTVIRSLHLIAKQAERD
jgi:hypothetical protein